MHYILSDIHGNERRFHSILAQIDLQPEDELYILGDVIDRHPWGLRILRRIMAMPNARMILGNHEYMMLRALGHPRDTNVDDGTAKAHWYRNGGGVTHRHWKFLRKTVRKEILDYLSALPLNIELEAAGRRWKLVHGAQAEGYAANTDPRYLTETHYAVWKRPAGAEPLWKDGTVIFGHTPTIHLQSAVPMEIWYGEGSIGIDCGCGFPEDSPEGRLACLRLEDGKVFYSDER